MYLYIHMFLFMYIYAHMYIYTCMDTISLCSVCMSHISFYDGTQTHKHIWKNICIYIHIYLYTHTHYIYTYSFYDGTHMSRDTWPSHLRVHIPFVCSIWATWASHVKGILKGHVTSECDMSFLSVTYVMSRMNESCLIWIRRVSYDKWSRLSYEWVVSLWVTYVMSRMNESCLIWMSRISVTHVCHVTYECVVSHVNASYLIWYVTSRLSYKWVIFRIWTSHVSRMNVSCHVCHVTYGGVAHVDEYCHA